MATVDQQTVTLNSPIKLGDVQLRNRNIMASMTRSRSFPTTVPNDANAEYYTQRAGSAGLILTEGTLISHQGTEWPNAPGIWSDEHVEGWSKVTQSVHQQGGLIFMQLWHVGRISNNGMEEQKLAGQDCVGPSAIAARGGKYRTLPGVPGHSVPIPIEDPSMIIEEYRNGAENAKKAGFDGVELHSANGYLPHQFLDYDSNKRTDKWGGSIENRTRFGLEALKVMIDVFGPGRVGIKINPCGGYNDVGMPLQDTIDTFTYYIEHISKLSVAYIQLVNYSAAFDLEMDGKKRGVPHDVLDIYGPIIKKHGINLLLNGDLNPDQANELINAGKIDAAVIGRPWINNPDLQARVEQNIALNNAIDYRRLYGSPEDEVKAGYSDYPFATESSLQ